ncbi:MAG: hypothetical protein R6V86_06115 [Spirochaetia bacterium]
MKRKSLILLALTISLVLLWSTGCTSTPPAPTNSEPSTESSSESGSESSAEKLSEDIEQGKGAVDWEISLSGVRDDAVNAKGFAEAKGHGSHYQTLSFEQKDGVNEYQGMPLRLVVAMVDGEDVEHPWLFDEEAWKEGYDITLTASDGYAVTFSTKELESDALYLADKKNGELVSPRIVGDVFTKLQIKDLVAIELSLGASTAKKTYELEIEINGEVSSFTREELENSPYYIEETGSYTTSAGTTHTHRYGGIKFADSLRSYVDLEADTTVKVVAMDGYTMTYSGEDLMDESDGTWILAFKSDGEYLPLDPGYVRSVKVGPSEPNIDGHSSARMIQRIVVSAEDYKEYELLIRGKMDNTLDRQTIQSGVSCHTRTVEYLDKKSGEVESYTGIPLWMLLAYGDDSRHAPHRQTDKSILSYKEERAQEGYGVKIVASDGYSITLDSRQLNKNDGVIIATQKDGETLPEREWPLILVWDQDADPVPEGIKAVRNIAEIHLLFD